MHNSQDMEAAQMPTDRWTDEDVAPVCNGALLLRRKECANTSAATRMDLEMAALSEATALLICGVFFLKKHTNELIYKREGDSQR